MNPVLARYARCRIIYKPVVVFILINTVIYIVDNISSRQADVLGIEQSVNEPIYVNGLHRETNENPDGSIDVVFNIPQGISILSMANISASRIDAEIFNFSLPQNTTTTTTPPAQFTVATVKYPLTEELKFLINPKSLCQNVSMLDYIIIVHTATSYFQRRMDIRETFGAKLLTGKYQQRVLFVVGSTNDPKTTRRINKEALEYGDILQGDYMDSYHTLTQKGAMWLRWVVEYCHNAKLIVKIDDDVFLDPIMLVKEYLPLYSKKTRTIMCDVRPENTSIIMRGRGKWAIAPHKFKGYSYYPLPYCRGYFVILTPDLLKPLYSAIKVNPFFWVDDIYLFGILPRSIGNVHFHHLGENTKIFRHAKQGLECYENPKRKCSKLAIVMHHWKPMLTKQLWKKLLSNLTVKEQKDFGLFPLS